MDAVVEEKVVEEPKVDNKPEWDKERQRADQAEANLRKSQARNSESELKSQQLEATVSELQGKMQQIEAVKGLDLATLDPNEADVPEIVREYAKMSKALKDTTKKITALEQKAAKYENDADTTRQEREKEGVIERICKPLDAKYGVSLRNEARRLAEEEVEVRGFAPKDALECRDMLEKHYITLSTEASKKKETVASDSGRGGSKVSFGDNITPGSLSDVMGQIRKEGLGSLIKKQ
jgi:uncharacterized protein YhaN